MKTVKIKAKLLMNADGKWAIYGWNDCTDDADGVLYDMMADEDINTAREFIITAEIPLPEKIEITATVEKE